MEKLRTSEETVDLAFSESEQAAIIACAAALQREEGLTATLSDLERAALEAGIEPRFVRQAVRIQSATPGTPEIATTGEWPIWRGAILAAILVPAEICVVAWSHDLFISLWGSVVIAALFGIGLPRRPSARWISAAWPIFVTLSIMVFDRMSRFENRWAVELLLAAIQSTVALSVCVYMSTHRRAIPHGSSPGRQSKATEK